jgi:hypothetical protein
MIHLRENLQDFEKENFNPKESWIGTLGNKFIIIDNTTQCPVAISDNKEELAIFLNNCIKGLSSLYDLSE